MIKLARFHSLILLASLSLGPTPLKARTPTVVFLVTGENAVYRKITPGLNEGIQASKKEITIQISADAVLDSIRLSDPDLVIAVGDAATLWAEKRLTDMPIMAAGMVGQLRPFENKRTAGVSLDFSPTSYFKLIREAFPEAKRLGCLVNAAMDAASIREFKRAAKDAGLEINLRPVQKEKAIGQAMQVLKDWNAEVFLLTLDPLIMNPESWKYLVNFSVANQMALVVPSNSLLKSGGVLALEADYVALGRQVAVMANKVLQDRNAIREMGMAYPAEGEISINIKTAKVIGIPVNDSVRKKAKNVYE